MNLRFAVFTLSATVAASSLSCAQTMFGGNTAHTGVSESAGPKVLKGPKWSFKTGGWVISSPAVSSDTVYVGSDDRHLYAIDRTSGTERWRFKTGAHVRSSPAISNGVIYFSSYDGNVYALDAATGAEKWKFATDGERRFEAPGLHGMKPATQTIPDFWDFYQSSPVVHDGVVYVGSGDTHVYALDGGTGELRWKFKTGGVVHSSPAVAAGTLYVGSWDTYLYALDAKTGQERWRFKTGEDKEVYNQTGLQSSPAVKDGVVYFGCRDAHLYAVDAMSGKERWRFSIKPTWINATPAIHDGVAYVGSSVPSKFYAVDLSTGKSKFELEADLIVFSSAAIAANYAYFGSFGGTLYAVDLTTGSYAWQFQTEARKKNEVGLFDAQGKANFGALGGSDFFEDSFRVGAKLLSVGSFVSSPAVADGVVYIGSTDGNVYAIE